MYQIVNADGSNGDPVDLSQLKEMAQDGRVGPDTILLDPITGKSAPAAEMFVGDELFAIVDPAEATDAAPSLEAIEPPPAAIVADLPPPAPMYTPIVTRTPEVTPPAAVSPAPADESAPTNSYPRLATDGVPDLGARFVGLFVDGLISIPLHALALIPFVGIVFGPATAAYWLSRDAFGGGQSLGKRVAKTKVVRLDGQPVTWVQSALRNIVYLPLALLAIPFLGWFLAHQLFGPCLLADIICVLVTQRRIGDFLANTQVVCAE